MLVSLFFGEIVLRTEENCRLAGYAGKYLGKHGRGLIAISTVLGIIGALLAYVIIGGNFLQVVFSFTSLSAFQLSLIFWVVLSFFVFRGVKLIAPAELIMDTLLILIIVLIFIFSFPKIDIQNFTLINTSKTLMPYGVILFSLVGWAAIPEISEVLKSSEDRKKYKKVIITGLLVIFLLYVLFTVAVVGVTGEKTTKDALLGLVSFLNFKVVTLGALLGAIAVAASFLVLGLYLKNTLAYDFGLPGWLGALISSFVPLILFLSGFRNFIQVIGLSGTIIGALEGIVIILIYRKVKKKGKRDPEYSLEIPEALLYCLIIIFVIGSMLQVL